jgi:DNA processing protein
LDNRLYWIWLQQALGQGSAKAGPLLRVFGSAEGIFCATEESLRTVGLNENERAALADRSLTDAGRILKTALKDNGWVLTPDDGLYPDSLREIFALPLVLYGRGEWPDFDATPALTVVGTRSATTYGMEMARYIAAGMAAAGGIVVSGGAVGIDAAAHWGALEAGGKTVAVLGGGLDQTYPAENEPLRRQILANGGALVSEYPPGTKAFGSHFPVRNRILSGLSWATCVAEAPKGSGSRITADYAREQGREVMAVPGLAGLDAHAGTNALIRDGACLVEGPADVLRQYRVRYGDRLNAESLEKLEAPRWKRPEPVRTGEPPLTLAAQKRPNPFPRRRRKEAPPKPTPPTPAAAAPAATCPEGVSDDARRMFDQLGDKPVPIDRLAAKAGLTPARAMAVLTELEIAGGARSHAGQQYSR